MKTPRRDANEREIVSVLEAAGCLVQPLTQGDGVPDLLVKRPDGALALLEVKDGAKPESARRLTADQQAWIARGWPVRVVTSAAEALVAVGVRRG